MSQLDRLRLRDNLLDRQDAIARHVRRQERVTATTDGRARVFGAGMLLERLAEEPDPPPAGYILLYILDDGSDLFWKAMDENGVVEVLATW